MNILRRNFLQLIGAAGAAPMFPQIAPAQVYPSRPITMIVPTVPGSIVDSVARVVAERMRGSLGEPIIIENVGGADGSIGVGRAARARPDGFTVDLGNLSTHVLNGAFYSLPYDLLNDFAPISPLVTTPVIIFARRTMAAKDLNELISWLKANPNKAAAGVGALGPRMVATFFQKETGTQFTLVPYRGGSQAFADLVAGHIDLLFNAPDALSLIGAASIKAYAVSTDVRLTQAPTISTFAEMGLPTLSFSSWFGLFAPKGTSKAIIGKLNAAVVEALGDPSARSRLAELGLEIFPRDQQTPEALGAMQRADAEKWWPIIKELGIKPD
jgi:tripartite-type tricarboxylate transporter receptor subunit TctC